jgi:arylsulfatase A
MERRAFLQTLGGALAAGGIYATGANPKKPNIIYVLADDLGWGDLRCYNPESAIATPHADRLAREGVRFTDMHSPSSVCTPTRYGILTGRYCWRTQLKSGVLWGYSPNLIEPGRMTVASLLRQQGYATAGIGKWHLGLGDQAKTDYSKRLRPGPLDHGFDRYFGIPASLDMEPYLYFENDRVVEPPTAHTPGQDKPRGVFWRPGPIAPNFDIEQVLPTLGRKACEYVRERARPEHRTQPYFLYLPLTAPHTPWVPLARYRGRTRAGDYGDFVAQVDDTLGDLLKTLDETGTAQDTLFIFTSDNGAHWTPEDRSKFAHRANAHWRGQKADIWDAGHRIPFLVRWPGRARPGTVSHQTGCLTDLLATAAAMAGAPVPASAGEDSYNLLPAILGTAKTPIREAVVHHSVDGMFSIRQGDWKLCLGLGSGGFSEPKKLEVAPGQPAGQLYHLKKDPSETQDLYAKHPEVVERLTALLARYRQEGRSRRV